MSCKSAKEYSQEYELMVLPSPPNACDESSTDEELIINSQKSDLSHFSSSEQESWWLNSLTPVSQHTE